jgi:hypothetical protein
MKLNHFFLSLALAAIVASTLNPTLLAQGSQQPQTKPCEHFAFITLTLWDDTVCPPAPTSAVPVLPPQIQVSLTGLPPAAPTTAPAQQAPTQTHLTAMLSLSREDREKLNNLIDALRAQDGNVAKALENLTRNDGDIRDILAAMQKDAESNHNKEVVDALNKVSDTLAEMLKGTSDAQVQLITALAGGIDELSKTQKQLLGVEQKRLVLEQKLVFWTRWGALADTAIAAAEWSQFGLALKTGGYGSSSSSAASASAAALLRQQALASLSKDVATF